MTSPGSDGLRILVVNWLDRRNPQAGGAEAHLHETFGRLAGRGHRVTLLCSGWPGAPAREELDGMEVRRTGGRHSFLLAAPAYFRRHLAGEGFDVVVEDLNKVPVFAPLWAGAPTVALVHHLFGATAFREASVPVAAATWLLERPLPAVYRDRPVIAVSASTRDDLLARGFRPGQVEVVPNGVDTDMLTPAPDGARFEEPTVLYLGRIKKYKRVDLVVRAVAALRDAGRPVRLVVAGKGDHLPRIRELVARLGLEDRVELPGFVDDAEKLRLFRRAWVHALTSPKEGWGIANLEAAACGTPTVASDAPGLRESVVDGRTGLLVPHGDVPALAAALGRILGDAELRDEMGRAAREFAADYTWDATADGTERVLRRVVHRAGVQ